MPVNKLICYNCEEESQKLPLTGSHEEAMQQSKKVTSEVTSDAHMNETLHDLQKVNGAILIGICCFLSSIQQIELCLFQLMPCSPKR